MFVGLDCCGWLADCFGCSFASLGVLCIWFVLVAVGCPLDFGGL